MTEILVNTPDTSILISSREITVITEDIDIVRQPVEQYANTRGVNSWWVQGVEEHFIQASSAWYNFDASIRAEAGGTDVNDESAEMEYHHKIAPVEDDFRTALEYGLSPGDIFQKLDSVAVNITSTQNIGWMNRYSDHLKTVFNKVREKYEQEKAA